MALSTIKVNKDLFYDDTDINTSKESYSTLDDLVNAYNSKKPSNGGSSDDYQSESDYWKNYQNALDNFSANNDSDSYDYTKYSLYRNYVNNQATASQSALRNYQLLAKQGLNSKTQQGILKDQSLKYANVALSSAGLEGSGVGGSIQAGIGNQYASNINTINSDTASQQSTAYENYKTQAASDQATLQDNVVSNDEANKNNSYDLATQMLNSGVDYDTVIKDYGSDLTDTQKNVLKDLANASANTALAAADKYIGYVKDQPSGGYTTKAQLEAITLDNGKSAFSVLNNELNYINGSKQSIEEGFQDSLTNGFVACLASGTDNSGAAGSKLYLVYKNGAWYKTTKQAYNEATNKKTIRGLNDQS